MPNNTTIRKIAFIGDYLPRKCGIATYTHDLRHAVASQYPQVECIVVPVNDVAEGYRYSSEVRFEIAEQELAGYRRAADFINFSNVDVVCLQHEFGIFGGPAGSHILALLRDLEVPVVTTLHTVIREPNEDQRQVLERLIQLSSRLIVMSQRGKSILQEVYCVPENKIDLIPHGIPDMPAVDPNFYKDQFGVEGKHVLLSFGLLSPNKGIEYVLRALPEILKEFPDTVYIVLGATHPHLLHEQGEAYRIDLERMTQELGIEKNVTFYNRFVELRELTEFIGATDIYITPYLNPAQVTSGTLAYCFGCGKAVVSTPYWHAEELLADGRGVLVPFADSGAIAREVAGLLRDDTRRHAMRKRAYLLGREMTWGNVAHSFMGSFQDARHAVVTTARRTQRLRTLDEERPALPRWKFDHLLRLTNSTGMFQHAKYAIPNFEDGYCTDDNARGLVLSVLLEELGKNDLRSAADAYAGFLNYAFDPQTRRFRNFLRFDRRWVDDEGSDDCVGRAVWALGTCVGRSQNRTLQIWAAQMLGRVLEAMLPTTSPRAWAFALFGIHEYLGRLSGDRVAGQIRETLSMRLLDLYRQSASEEWHWFEDVVTYCNARLPHALILSGRWMGNDEMLQCGLRSLRWLCGVQRSPSGCFRPIGNDGFFTRGQQPAIYDQQPIEACSTVSACVEAFYCTHDPSWLDEAKLAFDWFSGGNDLGQALYDWTTGGCRDGLHEDRVSENQGAESTLAFFLSLAEMRLLESALTSMGSDAKSMTVAREASGA